MGLWRTLKPGSLSPSILQPIIMLAASFITCSWSHNTWPHSTPTMMVPHEHMQGSLKSYVITSSFHLDGLFYLLFILITNTVNIPASVPLVVCLLHLDSHLLFFISTLYLSALWSGDLIGFDLPWIPFQLGQTPHFKLKLGL